MIGGQANEFTGHTQMSHEYATSLKLYENVLATSVDRRDAQISEFTVKRRPRCSRSNSLEVEFCGKNTPAHDHSTQCPYNMFYFRQFRHRGKTFSISDLRLPIGLFLFGQLQSKVLTNQLLKIGNRQSAIG